MSFYSFTRSAYRPILRSSQAVRTTILCHYSQVPGNVPSASTIQGRGMLPYFIGGVGGATAVVLMGEFEIPAGRCDAPSHAVERPPALEIGYGYYHFSGAKQVMDSVRAAKDRYVDTKVAVAEKSEVARDKMSEVAATAKEVARQKRTDLGERWAARLSRKDAQGEQGSKEEHEVRQTHPHLPGGLLIQSLQDN